MKNGLSLFRRIMLTSEGTVNVTHILFQISKREILDYYYLLKQRDCRVFLVIGRIQECLRIDAIS